MLRVWLGKENYVENMYLAKQKCGRALYVHGVEYRVFFHKALIMASSP